MAINFDRAMIDLVREVRRRAPPETKTNIRLANPKILDLLLDFYLSTEDIISKTLIKELFSRVGADWSSKLTSNQDTPDYQVKVYRGQVQLVQSKSSSDSSSRESSESTEPKKKGPKRVYRGQVIE